MTSPIKPGHAQIRGARAAQKRLKDDDAVSEVSPEQFLANYLRAASQQPEAEQNWESDQQVLVEMICDVKVGKEVELYTGVKPLIRLCNKVSKRVFNSLESQKVVTFHAHHDKELHDPLQAGLMPDIVVSYEDAGESEDLPKRPDAQLELAPSADRIFSWFNVIAVGEAKIRDPQQERYQTGHYLQKHLQLRPELHSVLGFSADTKGYSLYYHDASVIHQCSVGWDNALMLHAFIRQLHQGLPSDPSIVNLRPENTDPSWLVKVEEKLLLITCAIPDPGLGQRRLTAKARNVAMDTATDATMDTATDAATDAATDTLTDTSTVAAKHNHELWFIKDYYPDVRRRFNEGLLYVKAHKGKMLPGMMRVDHFGHPLATSSNRLTTTDFGDGPNETRVDRWKMRIATRDIGDSLSNAPSLLKFLKIMYDACVVQRHLYRKGILHRDISHGNIMMAPKDDGRYYKDCSKGFNEIKYLNQVLNPKESPKPACLVIDLGHGADRDCLAVEPHTLAEITGTPRFMSRSVSRGRLLDPSFKPLSTKIPKLAELSPTLYTSCAAEYDAYNEAIDNFAQPLSKPARTEFRHELFHDAESTFWVICWFLARSAPKDYKPENPKKSNPDLKAFVKAMETHIPGDLVDGRNSLSPELDVWERVLHPELVDVAPMLHEMHKYILPEWGYRPDLKEKYAEHAHEALMRLLLREIVRIDGDKTKNVEFALGETRNLPMPELLPPKSRSTTISTLLTTNLPVDTKKRGREDDGEDLTQPRRSKRLALMVESEPSIFDRLVSEARKHEWPQMDKWLELPTHLPSLSTSPSAA